MYSLTSSKPDRLEFAVHLHVSEKSSMALGLNEQGSTVQRRALRFLSKNIGSWQTLHAGMRHTLQVRYCIRNILTNKEADRWPEYMSSRLAKKIRSVTWQRCRLGLSAAKLLATQ